jgi:RHS repeat-associated protein
VLRALLIALVVTLALAHVAAAGTWSAVSVPRTEDLARVGRIRAGSSVAVDDNGNLTDDGRRFFFYDYKNRLVAVTDKATGNPIASYGYLPDGRRAKKVVYSQTFPGQVQKATCSYWDGAQEVEEQDAGSGATETTYVWSPVYVDELVTYTNSLGTFYTHQDARCDVVAITNAAGVVVERVRYDDFGKAEIRSALGLVVPQSAVGNAYGFQGRKLDAETGLLYFRARYYDPETGRFLQRDPVWDAGNVGGQYTFCGNGPVSGRDPSGEFFDEIAVLARTRLARSHPYLVLGAAAYAVGYAIGEKVAETYLASKAASEAEAARQTAAKLHNAVEEAFKKPVPAAEAQRLIDQYQANLPRVDTPPAPEAVPLPLPLTLPIQCPKEEEKKENGSIHQK